jgi:PhoH-like ATPase
MRNIVVLDTSVFIYDPSCYLNFKDSDVIIPITVIEELDKLKKFANETGKKARVSIKNLDMLSKSGDLHNGITIENNIKISVDIGNTSIGSDPTYGDSHILGCAVKIKATHNNVLFLSRDINLRIKARAYGLDAQSYEKDNINTTELYTGFKIINNKEAGELLDECGVILISQFSELQDLYPNECVVFVNDNGKGIASGRRIKDQIKLINDANPWGLELKNKEQLFAANLLLDPSIPLVSIVGRAGGGKSLIAVACGLELVLNKHVYDNFSIYRPIQPMGNEIGFLPGDQEDKLNPWFASIDDSFAFLFSDKSKNGNTWKAQLHQYINNGTIQKEALTYIRGRSIPDSFILIDEGQNLSQEEMKTILTRVGNNTKIVLTGDIEQIDNSSLDVTNNGLTYVVEKFKDNELAGHITFTKGERSALATLASSIL